MASSLTVQKPPASGSAPPAAAAPRRRRRLGLGPTTGAAIALIVLVVGNALLTPNFATASNFWNVTLQVSTGLLVAIGMTLVIATGGIDLSVGSIMAVAGAIAAVTLDRGIAVAIVLALLGALAVGVVNGGLIALCRVQPIVVTLATLIAIRGVAQIVSNDGELVPI